MSPDIICTLWLAPGAGTGRALSWMRMPGRSHRARLDSARYLIGFFSGQARAGQQTVCVGILPVHGDMQAIEQRCIETDVAIALARVGDQAYGPTLVGGLYNNGEVGGDPGKAGGNDELSCRLRWLLRPRRALLHKPDQLVGLLHARLHEERGQFVLLAARLACARSHSKARPLARRATRR